MRKLGVRIEDKYLMERRVAIVPSDMESLAKEGDIQFEIESSPKRVFSDSEFDSAGASVVTNLNNPDIIFGVKEMPIDFFEQEKTYVFFSHTIKGQAYNIPLLKRMIEKKINLIEYERITNDDGQRLIFFGRFAGLAGMINSFWSYGQRCELGGYKNPFMHIKQSHLYASLEDAIEDIKLAAKKLKEDGINQALAPLTIGFTGYGNVSKGAQEISDILDTIEVSPDELLSLRKDNNYRNDCVYKVVFKEKDISKNKDTSIDFELQHYYNNPEDYENNFEQYVPELSILMNCMYWAPEYPRIITKDFLYELDKKGGSKLCVIGDVTCDPDGSIESTHLGTLIEDPVYVYNPKTRNATMGFAGEGILTMAVDILPSELPKEASEAFSKALSPFIIGLAETDFDLSFEELTLPAPFKRALILHKGEFAPDYKYMEEFLK